MQRSVTAEILIASHSDVVATQGDTMTGTGIKVTPQELEVVRTAQKCSGMFLSGGVPMGDPQREVARLCKEYNPPSGAGLNIKTGEFMLP